MQSARNSTSRKTLCFPMFCGAGFSKSRLTKAAGQGQRNFEEIRNQKLHAVVARTSFGISKVHSIAHPEMSKKWTGCGAKHISKSKVLKKAYAPTTFGHSDFVSGGRHKDSAPRSTRDMFIIDVRRAAR